MRCGERDGVVDNLADLGDDLVGVDGARAVSGGSKRVRNALLRALDGAAGGVVKAPRLAVEPTSMPRTYGPRESCTGTDMVGILVALIPRWYGRD